MRNSKVLSSPKTNISTLPPVSVNVSGHILPVHFHRHHNACRLSMRLARDGRSVKVTMPTKASYQSARHFVHSCLVWLEEQLANHILPAALHPGACLKIQDIAYEICLSGKNRGMIIKDDHSAKIFVPGAIEHLPRRLRDWLKEYARQELSKSSLSYANKMAVCFRRLVVRDQKSRWGSCSHHGDLSYSWRLILAPPFVLDYVAAHEVAHLKHMNHSAAFWQLVSEHCLHVSAAQAWLKQYGARLHQVSL